METPCSIKMCPLQILNKGPEYFRTRQDERGTMMRSKSAVELLEETKSQYVKSTSVLGARQKMKNTENLQVGKRYSLDAAPQVSGITSDSLDDRRGHRHSIDSIYCLHKNGSSSKSFSENQSARANNASPVLWQLRYNTVRPRSEIYQKPNIPRRHSNTSSGSSYSNTGQTKAKRPGTENMEVESKVNKLDGVDLSSAGGWPEKDCKTHSGVNARVNAENRTGKIGAIPLITMEDIDENQCTTETVQMRPKRINIQRSRSDLCQRINRHSAELTDGNTARPGARPGTRLSRTSTDLEKFFNDMGLDNSVLEPMLRSQTTNKDGIHFFESASSIVSATARSFVSGESRRSDNGLSELNEAKNTHPSIVERNARIIKWLCNVRKARSKSMSEVE